MNSKKSTALLVTLALSVLLGTFGSPEGKVAGQEIGSVRIETEQSAAVQAKQAGSAVPQEKVVTISKKKGLKSKYLSKANALEQRIMNEAKKIFAHDMQPGFYGGYYEDWDNLLQEIWKQLRANMSKSQFNKLKAEQIAWVKKKEKHFNTFTDTVASERAAGMDYLAFETKDRVYYLIKKLP